MSSNETITVLVVEPEKTPYVKDMGSDLESLQKAVDGYIETVYPYEDPVALIVNEEGKLNGMPLNRALRTDDNEIFDIVAGTMLVVGLGEENFCSLTEDQIKTYSDKFRAPEQFIRLNGELLAIPMEPKSADHEESQIPVYRYPAAYAIEHGQMNAYRESFKANISCRDAIEAAIANHYRDNHLDEKGADQVMAAFGAERVQYVLASTIRHMDWDRRYEPSVRSWANSIAVYENKDPWGQDRNHDFMITQAHPGLVNLFAKQVQRLSAEQDKERPSVMDQLHKGPPSRPAAKRKSKEPER